ncbi:MAG: helix-turn-helix domain-containing protein [Thermodesulfobacteriota bacterium]|jgi:excisionase family DNA binding protein
MPNIVTAKEVSQYLKLTESTIYKLASTGEIPGFRIGKSWRFDMDEVLRRINGIKTTVKITHEANGRIRKKENGKI